MLLHDGCGGSLMASVDHPQASSLFGNLPASILLPQDSDSNSMLVSTNMGPRDFCDLLTSLVLDTSAWFDCVLSVRISLDENDVMQQSFVKVMSIEPIISL